MGALGHGQPFPATLDSMRWGLRNHRDQDRTGIRALAVGALPRTPSLLARLRRLCGQLSPNQAAATQWHFRPSSPAGTWPSSSPSEPVHPEKDGAGAPSAVTDASGAAADCGVELGRMLVRLLSLAEPDL